jgi:hypothetical protein
VARSVSYQEVIHQQYTLSCVLAKSPSYVPVLHFTFLSHKTFSHFRISPSFKFVLSFLHSFSSSTKLLLRLSSLLNNNHDSNPFLSRDIHLPVLLYRSTIIQINITGMFVLKGIAVFLLAAASTSAVPTNMTNIVKRYEINCKGSGKCKGYMGKTCMGKTHSALKFAIDNGFGDTFYGDGGKSISLGFWVLCKHSPIERIFRL